MMRYALLLLLAACAHAQSPAPAPARAPAAPPTAVEPSTKPVWIGVLFEVGTARITQVIAGSPADLAGIQRDDVLVEFASHPITLGTQVSPLVQAHGPGQAKIGVERAGRKLDLLVTIVERPRLDALGQSLLGRPAPAFTLPLVDGGTLSLGELRGHIVVLDFWATWCGPCRAQIPHLQALQKAHPDVRVIGISTEEIDEIKGTPTGYPVARDPDETASRDYLVMGMPTTYVLDEQGVVRHVEIGFGDPDALERVVASLRSSPSP